MNSATTTETGLPDARNQMADEFGYQSVSCLTHVAQTPALYFGESEPHRHATSDSCEAGRGELLTISYIEELAGALHQFSGQLVFLTLVFVKRREVIILASLRGFLMGADLA